MYVQADGTVVRGWLYDGVQYYRLDDAFGALIGTYSSKPIGSTYKEYNHNSDGSYAENTFILLEDGKEDLLEHKEYYANGKLALENSYGKSKSGRYRNLVKNASYNEECSVNWISLWEYDEDDEILTEKTYDANGNVAAEGSRVYNDDGSYRYVYNSIREDGSIFTSTNEYTYDSNGKKVKEVYSDSDGQSIIYDYTYINDICCCVKAVNTRVVDIDSTYTRTYEYAYDTAGNMINETWSDSNGYTSISDYVFINEKPYRVKYVYITTRDDGSTYSITGEYEYDANGRLIKESYSDSEGHLYKSE